RSVSSEDYKDPVIEEAQVRVKGTANTLNQLSSAADAAKKTRTVKAAAALDAAVRQALLGENDDSKLGNKDKNIDGK
ncbi:hypothetical protein AJ80_05926, partial [Polytolypa hystricis UAMH7299]